MQASGASQEGQSAGRTVQRRPSVLLLLQDLAASFRTPGFWLYGAWIDASLRHRSQALGALWSVAGTLAFVVLLGTLYSQVLVTQDPTYFAHLATGYVVFSLVQQSLRQSTSVFVKNRGMIQNGYVKYVDYVLRMFCAELITVAYKFTIVLGAIIIFPVEIGPSILVLALTFPLFLGAVLGLCLLLSVVGARYPDVGELVKTVLRIAFFITPIIWVPNAISGKGAYLGSFLYANPFYYLIEIIRAPLVYGRVPWLEIIVVATAIPIIWLLASLAYRRARPYIPLWV